MSIVNEGNVGDRGVIYGYRTFGEYPESSVFYFGRSRLQAFYETEDNEQNQKQILKKLGKKNGLNGAAHVICWKRVANLSQTWLNIKNELLAPSEFENWVTPLVTQQTVLGEQYVTVENVHGDYFGSWAGHLISSYDEMFTSL